MLDLKRLRVLREVAERGSFSAAADHLHVSQSAVSQQISALEAEVGVPLLVRLRGGPQLTEAGSLLEQLSRLFPRIAVSTAVVIVLCVAADYGLARRAPADLTDSLTELSEQWLFAAN